MSPIAYARCNVISLVAIALTSALIWRLEVEWHGWSGLTWITYFHWAIPIGFGLFLAWLAVFCAARDLRRRIGFVIVVALIGVATYPLLDQALRLHFIRGPSAMMAIFYDKPMVRGIGAIGTYGILLSSPILLWGTAYMFGIKKNRYRLCLSFIICCASIPFALTLLYISAPPHPVDEIHTIKSGFVIVPLVIGMGIMFAPPLKLLIASPPPS